MTGERILVTGGAGFIGSALVRALLAERDSKVQLLNLDALTYAAHPGALASIESDSRYKFARVDLRDAQAVTAAVRSFQPSCVVHLAAETHVDRSLLDETIFVESNVLGTTHLLQAVRAHFDGLPQELAQQFKFVHVSTDEVFGSAQTDRQFSLDSAYAPNSPYSASKAAADHLVRAWHCSYGLPTCIATGSNTYGPFQFPEKLIPFMIVRGLAGESMPVYGDGQQQRDWLHVDDHVAALRAVLDRGQAGQTYLVGSGEHQTNVAVVRKIAELLDAESALPNSKTRAELIQFVEDRPGHDFRYALDIAASCEQLQWRPQHDFAGGLQSTVSWYLQHQDWLESVTSGAYRAWVEANYAWRK